MINFLKERLSLKAILPALFIALFASAFFLSKFGFSLSEFHYDTVGQAILNNIDVNKRITIITISIVLAVIVFAVFLILFSRKIEQKWSESAALEVISGLGIVVIIYQVMSHTNQYSYGIDKYVSLDVFNNAITILFFSYLFFVIALFISGVDIKRIISSYLLSLVLVFCIHECFYCLSGINNYSFDNFTIGLLVFTFSVVLALFSKVISEKVFTKLLFVGLALAVLNIINTFVLEGILILNTRNVFIQNTKHIVLLIYLIGFVTATALSFSKLPSLCFKKSSAILATLTLIMILAKAYQPEVTNYFYGTDYYEMANGSNSVYGLLQFGKIPLLETFSAHMIGDVVPQVFYGLLTGDYVGAATSYFYNIYTTLISLVILYFFLRIFFDDFSSFAVVIFFPFGIYAGFVAWCFGLITVIAIYYCWKKRSILSCILYLTALIVVILYRLDVGAMYAFGTAPIFLVLLIKQIFKDKKTFFKMLITCFAYGLSIIFIVLIACAIKHINVFSTAGQFIQLVSSNYRWGLLQLGPAQNYPYVLLTWLLPILVLLLYFVFMKKRGGNSVELAIVITSLVLAFVFNFGRALVRHTLAENTYEYAASISVIAIPLLLLLILNNKKAGVFSISMFAVLFVFSLTVSQTVTYVNSSFDSAISLKTDKYDDYDEKIERIYVPEDYDLYNKKVKTIIDCVLEQDETFMALGWGSPAYYAFVEKECPIYENQICGILSGEKSQKYLLEEWQKRDDVILAITDYNCLHVDDICPQIQHRYVYKYLGLNYTACFNYGENIYWAKKGYEDIILNKLQGIGELLGEISFDNLFADDFIALEYAPLISGNNSFDNSQELFYVENPVSTGYGIMVEDCEFDKDVYSYFRLEIDNPDSSKYCHVIFEYEYAGEKKEFIVRFNVDEYHHEYCFYIDSTILWNCTKIMRISVFDQGVNKMELVW